MVMAGSSALAERYFPQFEGWIRILGAPSLADLERKAARAKENSTPYEALSYGLETSASTPREEWQNLVQSAQSARAIADRYGKLLVMGPGLRLMTQNEDQYPAMAALADIWMIQTQRLQANPPGGIYRREVMTVIDSIRSGNPQIKIWAQITFPPDQDPNAQDWMAYRDSIADLVHGIYMGVYHWNADNEEKLNSAISAVFTNACGGGANP